jgi:alkylated DNA repair protein alkB family protein 8
MSSSSKSLLGAAAATAAFTSEQQQQQQAAKRRQRVETAQTQADDGAAAEFEAQHVHGVYSAIAQKFSDTRYRPWPKVLEFVKATPPGSILIDVGCGNGKNLGRLAKSDGILEIGCDRSVELLQFAVQRDVPAVACDMMSLPFRAGCADRVICIAVLHHLSTAERRLGALRQMFRLLRPGTGRMLVYVWSTEFAKSEIKKGRADPSVLPAAAAAAAESDDKKREEETTSRAGGGADVFVSFANNSNVTAETATPENAPGRYYHLFSQGEIEALSRQISTDAELVKSWYDCENWAVEIAHRGTATSS